jgi:hypothetical protein
MRKLLLAAAGAMALVGGATTANAAAVVSAPLGPVPATVTAPGTFIIGSNLSSGPGTFSDMFTFTLGGTSALFNGQVSSKDFTTGVQDITFTSLLVDGASVFTKTSSDPNPDTWAILSPILLDAGSHTITVGGNLLGANGSYVGNFNVQTAAVPEAATWAMMLLGFGGMGMVIRRRRKPVLAQLA